MEWQAILFVIFFVLVVLGVLTKQGHNIYVRSFYGKIVKDYGDIGGATKVNSLMGQSVRLLQCNRKGEMFYVLETRFTALLSYNVQYTKINQDLAQRLVDAIKPSQLIRKS